MATEHPTPTTATATAAVAGQQYDLLSITTEAIPALMALSARAFTHDSHTRFKMHEAGIPPSDIGSQLAPKEYMERVVVGIQAGKGVGVMAVLRDGGGGEGDEDKEEGEGEGEGEGGRIAGYTTWHWWNADKDVSPMTTCPSSDPTLTSPVPPPPPTTPGGTPLSPLALLAATTSGHMTSMISRLNTPETRTLYCSGISVDPELHARGAASLMISHIVQLADEARATCWVHVSDHPGARGAFGKFGFVDVNSVTVDLDSYATKDKPVEAEGVGMGEEGKWGKYTLRMMVRAPRVKA